MGEGGEKARGLEGEAAGKEEGARKRCRGRKKRQETWRIWSAKCEEFSPVTFTVASIDTADIYYRGGGGLDGARGG